MALSRKAVFLALLAGTVSTRWRHGRSSADAAVLSSYPAYCSKDMEAYAIPPLEESVQSSFAGEVSLADVELLQVHAIIRHGARGPYTRPRCWKGYDMQWDCNVTQVVSPSLSPDEGGVAATGLFRKVYDAYPSENALSGTCMVGQLLDEGYEQEQANGRHLRDAYLCDEPVCLAGANATAKDLQDGGALYLRSDDEQRTVMSGQILTASMLDVSGAVLDWHTGDDKFDYLEPNEAACPRLEELSQEALSDASWTEWTDSFEVKALNTSLTEVWEEEVVWWDVVDCLMTTACTGRGLPEELTEDLFEAAADFSTKKYVHESLFNDAAFGKLAMAKFTLEIRERMMGAMNGTSPLKFVLLSGHDSTLMPFLAAVAPTAWDQQWPPYASLASIELLRVGCDGGGNSSSSSSSGSGSGSGSGMGGTGSEGDDGDDLDYAAPSSAVGSGGEGEDGEYYFRFVYNGQVLQLEGCDQDICAVDAFLNATQFSEDLDDSSHCCCKNMTQAAVDDYEASKSSSSSSGGGGGVSVSPAPATGTPAPGLSEEGAVMPESSSNGSGLTAGATVGADSATGGDDDDDGTAAAAAGGALGIAFACFVIGAIFGGVPALMYFRSFRYEQMRGGGHSYEMT